MWGFFFVMWISCLLWVCGSLQHLHVNQTGFTWPQPHFIDHWSRLKFHDQICYSNTISSRSTICGVIVSLAGFVRAPSSIYITNLAERKQISQIQIFLSFLAYRPVRISCWNVIHILYWFMLDQIFFVLL